MHMAFSLVLATFWLAAPPALYTDYGKAYETAQAQKKWLVIDFGTRFDFASIDAEKLDRCVICQLDTDAVCHLDGREQRVRSHEAFRELSTEKGIVIVDFQSEEYKSAVVSVLTERHLQPSNVAALLDLPTGSLTQRTLVWALRIHPDQPQSVYGTPDKALMEHAQQHSLAQANSNTQYHNLPVAIAQSEIVAESWPWNHCVVEAALDIVHSWSQSPGHWGAACRPYQFYGYDMKHSGQKWFATGVFR